MSGKHARGDDTPGNSRAFHACDREGVGVVSLSPMLWIGLVLSVASEPARVELALEWQAPPECPQAAEVDADVRAALADRDGITIGAAAQVTRTEGPGAPWRLELRLHDANGGPLGERVIEGGSCEALTDAAVVVLAVAATTAAALPTAIPSPPPAPEETVAPPEPVLAVSAPAEAAGAPSPAVADAPPRPRARTQGELAIAGGFDAGGMPGLGGTIAASLGLRHRWLGVHAFALHGILRNVANAGVRADHLLVAGGLGMCALGRVRSFELGGCVKAELGWLRSRGRVGEALAETGTLWGAASLGARARWIFATRGLLGLDVDAVVPFFPRPFLIGDAQVGRSGPLGVRLLAAIGVRFG